MNREDLIQKKFAVVATVRNVGNTLIDDFHRINQSLPTKNICWFVVESDSCDNTLDKLYQLSKANSFLRYKTMGCLSVQMPNRIERISHCRNVYLNEIKTNIAYNDVDYVVVADLDGLNSEITSESFCSCWDRDDWDVCTANQIDCYYDIYALRHADWCPSDCFHSLDFFQKYPNRLHKFDYFKEVVLSKMLTIPPDSPWIEVDSAFGGLAVYKKTIFVKGIYHHLDDFGRVSCEHVFFHKKIKSHGGRIYINPALINAKNTEHDFELRSSKLSRLFKRVHKSLMKRIRKIQKHSRLMLLLWPK